jgi:HNH endonuclease
LEARTSLPGLGPAAMCQASGSHDPLPLRFVWHHVQPAEAGGLTVASNLVQLCDSCHYSVHRLLWHLAQNELHGPVPLGPVPRRVQLALALTGFSKCMAAGTVAQIPNEG